MYRELFTIYGPLSINSFGLMIALGILVFAWLVLRNPLRASLMTTDQFLDTLMVGTIIGVVGARALCMAGEWQLLDHWYDMLKFWQGGYSVLGAIIGVSCFLPLYLRRQAIPILPSLDLFALYAPLLQAIARFGCFFAGCCYGKVTALPWAVTYTEASTIAPRFLPLHPTQVYSSLMLLIIFFFLQTFGTKIARIPGQMVVLYLSLAGFERFLIDFLRDDQEFSAIPALNFISLYQWIALSLGIVAGCIFLARMFKTPAQYEQNIHESV